MSAGSFANFAIKVKQDVGTMLVKKAPKRIVPSLTLSGKFEEKTMRPKIGATTNWSWISLLGDTPLWIAFPAIRFPKTLRMYNVFFFFNDTATTEIYTNLNTLSLHDALPI